MLNSTKNPSGGLTGWLSRGSKVALTSAMAVALGFGGAVTAHADESGGNVQPSSDGGACVIESASINITPPTFEDTAFVEPILVDGTFKDYRAHAMNGLVNAELKISDSAQPGDKVEITKSVTASKGLNNPNLITVWPAKLTHSDGTVLATRTSEETEGVYELTDQILNYSSNRTLNITADARSYGFDIDEKVLTKPSKMVGTKVDTTFSTCASGSDATYSIKIKEVVVPWNRASNSRFTPTQQKGDAISTVWLPLGHKHGFIEFKLGEGKEALDFTGVVKTSKTTQKPDGDEWAREVAREWTEVKGKAPLKPGQYRVTLSDDKKTAKIEVHEYAGDERTAFSAELLQVGPFPEANADGERFAMITKTATDTKGKEHWTRDEQIFYLDPEGLGDGNFSPVALDTKKVRDGEGNVAVGETVDYTLTVKNTDERTAYGVVVTDNPPAGLEFVSASDGGKLVDGKVVWPAADIKAGESLTFKTSMRVTEGVEGSLKNVVAVNGQNACTENAGDESVCTDEETIEVGDPVALKTEKTRKGEGNVAVGDVIEYTLNVQNTDKERTATGVVVTDTPPAGLEFVSASNDGKLVDGKVVWPATDIKADESLTFTTSMRVTEDATGSLKNVATANGKNACVEGDEDPSCSDDETVNVSDLVALNTEKVREGSGSVSAGDVVDYTLTVENVDKNTARGVVVTDTPPAGLEFVSASDGGELVDGKVVWPATDIEAGKSLTFTTSMRVKDDATGSLKNVVSVNGENACTDDADDSSVCSDDETVDVAAPEAPAAPGNLAHTGFSMGPIAFAMAGAMLLAGGTLFAVSRRKKLTN